ncbi:cycloartenol-C-24-methyltransferase-like protein, partial [Tanacetum coccineum]
VVWTKILQKIHHFPGIHHFSLSSFRLTTVGRFITKNMVVALEYVGLSLKGSQRVQSFLEKAAEGLVAGGKSEIYGGLVVSPEVESLAVEVESPERRAAKRNARIKRQQNGNRDRHCQEVAVYLFGYILLAER